jgi:hypothetical protein
MGDRNTHWDLNEKAVGKGPFEKSRQGCEVNIKLYLYTEREAVDWIHVAPNMGKRQAVVSTVKK